MSDSLYISTIKRLSIQFKLAYRNQSGFINQGFRTRNKIKIYNVVRLGSEGLSYVRD